MLETIVDKLPIPSWGLLILLSIIVIWKICKWFNGVDGTCKEMVKTNERIGELVVSHNELVQNHNQLSVSFGQLSDGFWDLYFRILGLSHSPVGLSPKFREVISKSGFDKFINEHSKIIESGIDAFRNKDHFDKQKGCLFFLMRVSEEKVIDIDFFKKIAFQEGLTESEMYIAGGLYIWEIFFKDK